MSAGDTKTQINIEQSLSRFIVAVQREMETVALTIRERGLERFGRILLIGIAAISCSYAGFYLPARNRVAGLDKRLATVRSTAQYADRYKDVERRLDRVYSLLPKSGQADNWVLDRVRETLGSENLVPDSIEPPENHSVNGYTEQVVRFSMNAKFPELAAWLNDLEYGSGLMQVTSLYIDKQAGGLPLGVNRVACSVETLVPSQRIKP